MHIKTAEYEFKVQKDALKQASQNMEFREDMFIKTNDFGRIYKKARNWRKNEGYGEIVDTREFCRKGYVKFGGERREGKVYKGKMEGHGLEKLDDYVERKKLMDATEYRI